MILSDEQVRPAVQYLKQRLTSWRVPPPELAAESVLEEIVIDIMKRGVNIMANENVDAVIQEIAKRLRNKKYACGSLSVGSGEYARVSRQDILETIATVILDTDFRDEPGL